MAVVPVYSTAPETGSVSCCKVKFSIVIVEGSIATLKIAEILLLMAILVASVIGSVEVTLGRTPVSSSFLQPAINTINSIAMIGTTFLSFILVYFNYFKLKKIHRTNVSPLIPERVTQFQKRVASNTHYLSRDIALKIIKKSVHNKQRSFFMLQMFTVSLIEVFMIYGLVIAFGATAFVLVNTTAPVLASILPTAVAPEPIVMDVMAITVP